MGWFDYVNIWAQDNGYEEAIRVYRHRVVITSPEQATWMTDGPYICDWSGMATIGPAGSEYVDFFSSGHIIYWPVSITPVALPLVSRLHPIYTCIEHVPESAGNVAKASNIH